MTSKTWNNLSYQLEDSSNNPWIPSLNDIIRAPRMIRDTREKLNPFKAKNLDGD